MKKIIALISLVFLCTSYIKSQTVENIKVEQNGNLIKIRYQIVNSTSSQVFRVKVLCSINGGANTEIKSISGDVGDQVMGGKSEYWVVWDVLKDVDEIKSVEFTVRTEIVKDNSLPVSEIQSILSKRRIHLYFEYGFPGNKFGAKIGYMGSWGASVMFLIGNSQVPKEESPESSKEKVFASSFDLTKRIINKPDFQMHLFIGVNNSTLYAIEEEYYNYYNSNFTGYEGGLIFSGKRLTSSVTFNYFNPNPEYGIVLFENIFMFVGVGIRL